MIHNSQFHFVYQVRQLINSHSLAANLGAERLISAEKDRRKIVVEIKSFLGHSNVRDLQQAIGQYVMYRQILDKSEPDRLLYLAITEETFNLVFKIELGQLFLDNNFLRLIVCDKQQEIVTWIK
ncbi:MAG: hypothetical protein GY865_06755 [candidate division Zixibacteria bacterium]|nr:hypothetical protein [candidate division Zixibacteria bacterium]